MRKYQEELAKLPDLTGKRIAVTGSTGGIGTQLCLHLARQGATIVQLDRNPARSQRVEDIVKKEYPNAQFERYILDLASMKSVFFVTDQLKQAPPDVLIHNAGIYDVPRYRTEIGVDNVFQVNFLAPYYMTKELLPFMRARGGTVIVVGSIAHNYSKIDEEDVQFISRRKPSLVYGNSKRYLTYAMEGLFQSETDVALAITHPGITLTNITAHYPPWLFAIIKYPMKVIFMHPKKAALSILAGLYEEVPLGSWVGPSFLDIWGLPKVKPLKTADESEKKTICSVAEQMYQAVKALRK